MKIDILHTADWHLWHKHKYTRLIPGKHWDDMFEAKMEVLKNTFIPFCKENQINHFIIAGDVFEHYNPIEPVRREFIKLLIKISENVESVSVLLGNHDIYKGQKSLESLWSFIYTLDVSNIDIYYEPFIMKNERISVDHRGVYGFEANNGYIEKPENVVKLNVPNNTCDKVLLGHYHKNQYRDNIYYSGSPYPVNFGEQNEKKYFNIFYGNKFKRIEIEGIKFQTLNLNKNEELKEDVFPYRVIRLQCTCTPDKEKYSRQIILEMKKKIMESGSDILDVIVDLKVIKESIQDKLKKGDKEIRDYKEIIDALDIKNKFKKYIYKKFEEIES